MEEERRTRKGLTPLSGELRIEADWTPPGPVDEKHQVKPERQAPTTTRGMLVHGIRRFAIVLAALCALVAGAALLLVIFTDTSASRALTLAFYVGGAVVTVGGFVNAVGGPSVGAPLEPELGYDREEREGWIGSSFVYGAFGITLIGIGVLLDSVL